MEKLYDKIDEEVGIFTNVEGTGLYELQSKLNHSCQPNVQVGSDTVTYAFKLKQIYQVKKIYQFNAIYTVQRIS